MKKLFWALPLVALVAACSEKTSNSESTGYETSESRIVASRVETAAAGASSEAAASADAAAGPAINITAAPGVAFNYRYAYRLPNAKISAVQEEHAKMCENLGPGRCRITGLRYRLVDEEDVSAALELKLEPSIARQFGKDAAKSVSAAEGMVVDTEISGVDAGGAITEADRSIARARDELARIEAQLKQKLSAEQRLELTNRAAALRAQIGGMKDVKTGAQDSLATTPMVFNYGSGSVVPGFDGASPISEGFKAGINSFMTMIGVILMVGLSLLPWIALGLSLLWLWRRYRLARWFARTIPSAAIDASPGAS